ncbi:hypothetical protein FPOAC2_11974 [Fusarium poae]|jgi:hypothetical protein|uniref:hypothetical protein n=1 Tax=Fusarium poae TaxID=36050 RepID=UPI001CE8D65F|nr:hypothetical protein FPOAC1_011662 [Fusarium poae]KAG8666841.1 hypothetical protein FPOAC1_011662 [Fusarium poae]
MPLSGPETFQDGIWRKTLLSSPWFDCPTFEILLSRPIGSNDLDMTPWEPGTRLVTRDPRHPELLILFLEKWWLEAVNWHMRRFDNGDLVLPLTAGYYEEQYGSEAMNWPTFGEEANIKNQFCSGEDYQQVETRIDERFPDDGVIDAARTLVWFSVMNP